MLQRTIIKPKRKNLFVEDEEIAWLWHESKKYPKLQLAIGFAMIRGFRSEEICAINIDDWRGTPDLTKIEAILEKSNIKDEFPIIKEFVVIVNEYIQKNLHLLKNGYLFSSYTSTKREHWDNNTFATLFARLRNKVGKNHPQILEKYKTLTARYKILKVMDQGIIHPKDIRTKQGGQEKAIRKQIDNLYQEGFIDIDSKLTTKGKEYISKEHYAIRFRVSVHSIRRWFETTLYEKGLKPEEIADIMRYLDPRTVYTYLNPYKVWKNEKEILKNTIGEKFREIEMLSEGQVRLNRFFDNPEPDKIVKRVLDKKAIKDESFKTRTSFSFKDLEAEYSDNEYEESY